MATGWRTTRDYRVWRATVIRRDKACVICGKTKGRQAHHINDGSNHPDERYDVDNGITLCGGSDSCHTAFHTMYKSSFRKKATRADWLNFVDLVRYTASRDRIVI